MKVKITSRLKFSVLVILCALLLVWIFGIPISSEFFSGEKRNYFNDQYCFELSYPGRWRIHSYGERGYRTYEYQRMRIGSSNFARYKVSVEQKTFNKPTIDEIANWSEYHLLYNGGLGEKTEVVDVMIDGREAGSRIFTSGTTDSKWREIYIPRENDGLVIRLLTSQRDFDEGNKFFDEMLESFRYRDACP